MGKPRELTFFSPSVHNQCYSEQKANSVNWAAMPSDENEPMTREEADVYKRNLSLTSQPHVEDAYRAAHSDCAFKHGVLPTPAEIQRLLCCWKVLWRWARK